MPTMLQKKSSQVWNIAEPQVLQLRFLNEKWKNNVKIKQFDGAKVKWQNRGFTFLITKSEQKFCTFEIQVWIMWKGSPNLPTGLKSPTTNPKQISAQDDCLHQELQWLLRLSNNDKSIVYFFMLAPHFRMCVLKHTGLENPPLMMSQRSQRPLPSKSQHPKPCLGPPANM